MLCWITDISITILSAWQHYLCEKKWAEHIKDTSPLKLLEFQGVYLRGGSRAFKVPWGVGWVDSSRNTDIVHDKELLVWRCGETTGQVEKSFSGERCPGDNWWILPIEISKENRRAVKFGSFPPGKSTNQGDDLLLVHDSS